MAYSLSKYDFDSELKEAKRLLAVNLEELLDEERLKHSYPLIRKLWVESYQDWKSSGLEAEEMIVLLIERVAFYMSLASEFHLSALSERVDFFEYAEKVNGGPLKRRANLTIVK